MKNKDREATVWEKNSRTFQGP